MKRTGILLTLLLLVVPGFATAQKPVTAPRPDDAVVYALAIKHLFPKGGMVVFTDLPQLTPAFPARLTGSLAGVAIDSSALRDFTRQNSASVSLRGILDSIAAHLDRPVTFIDADSLRRIRAGGSPNHFWNRFYAAFPGAMGRFSVSPIGYSADGNMAVLNVDHGCGGLCGTGHIVVLKRVNGMWTVLGDMMTWIS